MGDDLDDEAGHWPVRGVAAVVLTQGHFDHEPHEPEKLVKVGFYIEAKIILNKEIICTRRDVHNT